MPRRAALGAVLVAVILACLAFAFPYVWPRGANPVLGTYYVNEETGELSIQPLHAIPPLPDAAGQPVLVRACLYTADGGKTKSAAYYEKYSDAVQAMLAAGAQDPGKYDDRLFKSGRLVRLPEKGSPWVEADSDAGRKIIAGFPTGANITGCSVVLR
jgi:hypothetical protein